MKNFRHIFVFFFIWIFLTLACALPGSVSIPTAILPTNSPTVTPVPTQIPGPILIGKIAYSSDRDGKWQIITMNADGSAENSLTTSFGEYSRPSWSPDGKQLGLRIETGTGNGIAVMNVGLENGRLTGTQPIALTNEFSDGPQWSPDGRQLVFVSTPGGGGWITQVVDASGSQAPVTLTNIPENSIDPDWSPDAKQIVFSYYTDPQQQIKDLYVVNIDGSGYVQLTNTPDIGEDGPSWSPDGKKIAFSAYKQSDQVLSRRDIYIMNSDGTGVFQLTTDPASEFDPVWSPDGKQIAFTSDRYDNNDGNYEIYVINTDGTGELRLTNNHSTDRWPTWRAFLEEETAVTSCQPGMELVGDVTIPAGTRFASPENFSKVWRLKNSGTCTWTPNGYHLLFSDGEQMGGPQQVNMPGAIQPGATIDMVIPQVAPDAVGIHNGKWQLVDGNGQPVPGADGKPFVLNVNIEVLAPGQSLLPAPLYMLTEKSGTAQIWRMETDARILTQITNEYQPVTSFAVSPADGKLAYISQNQLLLADKTGANRQVLFSSVEGEWSSNLAWSLDGTRLAYALNGIRIYDLTSGTERILIANNASQGGDFRSYQPLSWSPDGSKILVQIGYFEGVELGILSSNDGTILAKAPFENMYAWNNDSLSLYIASSSFPSFGGAEPGLWQIAANSDTKLLIANAFVWWPFQRPDGMLMYFMSQPADQNAAEFAPLLYLSDADGSNPSLLRRQAILINQFDRFDALWAADGNSAVVRLERNAIDVNEILLLPANSNPPLFLMQESKKMEWGKQ
jgi:Tol biopolymer transport system component